MNNVTSRFSLPVAALLIAASLISSPAQADCAATGADIESCSKHSSETTETTDSAHALAVVKNADGSVSIKVENVEILHIDETGIMVNGNIEYTGVISDIGSLPREDGGRDEE